MGLLGLLGFGCGFRGTRNAAGRQAAGESLLEGFVTGPNLAINALGCAMHHPLVVIVLHASSRTLGYALGLHTDRETMQKAVDVASALTHRVREKMSARPDCGGVRVSVHMMSA